jgi:hypothetical protein
MSRALFIDGERTGSTSCDTRLIICPAEATEAGTVAEAAATAGHGTAELGEHVFHG